jgi:hypothetical protein
MTNTERVLHFIAVHSPRRVTNSEIRAGTGIRPHQQVFQITQRLMTSNLVRGIRRGHEWAFWTEQAAAT